ncbi:hypothetical protein [Clostridium sp.]|jgi:hypothetical protein|nr:hypothetical protein [Clostridium sp.]MDF2505824.1 hypothetical protein [Clostridium sp.]
MYKIKPKIAMNCPLSSRQGAAYNPRFFESGVTYEKNYLFNIIYL